MSVNSSSLRDRALSQLLFQGPHGSSSILYALKKKAELCIQSRIKSNKSNSRVGVKQFSYERSISDIPSSNNEDEQQQGLGNDNGEGNNDDDNEEYTTAFYAKMQRVQGLNGQYNQSIVDYLYHKHKAFYSMIKHEYNPREDDVLRKLSMHFRLNQYESNRVIFHYGDYSDKYYLICKGQVDLLYPYYDKQMISPEAMIVYLLRLKRYNETEMLIKVIELNSHLFIFGDKKFDIWITAACATLLQLQIQQQNEKQKQLEGGGSNEELIPQQKQQQHETKSKGKCKGVNISHNRNKSLIITSMPIKSINGLSKVKIKTKSKGKKKKYTDQSTEEEDLPILLVPYAKNMKFIKTIENELRDTIRIINDKTNTYNTIINEVSCSDYISRLLPPNLPCSNNNNNTDNSKEAIIMKYHHNNTFKQGNQFGEIALEANLNQMSSFPLTRICTAITKEASHLAYFEKKSYLDYIKPAFDKAKKSKVESLKSFRLFLKTKKNQIIKNYASFFNEVSFEHDEFIIREGDSINNASSNNNQRVYFIKEGEFEAYCYKTITEINQLLTDLGNGEQIQDKIRTNPIPETDEYFSIMNIKNKFRLSYFRYNDVVGLEDCYLNGHYIYSVQCKSKKGRAYDINAKLLEYLISLDDEIKKSSIDLVNSKQKLLIDILFKQRDIKLEFSYLFNKDTDGLVNRRQNIDLEIFKREIKVPYVPRMQSNLALCKDNRDIDITLINTSSKMSLAEYRKMKTLLFIKKYKLNKEGDKYKESYSIEKKVIESMDDKRMIQLNYSIKPKLNKTQSDIDPLVYDNFNRIFNTSLYYQRLFDKPKPKVNSEKRKNYNIKLIVSKSQCDIKNQSERPKQRQSQNKSCINFFAYNKDLMRKRSDKEITQSIINRRLRMIYDSKKIINKNMTMR